MSNWPSDELAWALKERKRKLKLSREAQENIDRLNAMEKPLIKQVLKIAAEWGYGNIISHLKIAWKKDLIKHGMSEEGAEFGSRLKRTCEKCKHELDTPM